MHASIWLHQCRDFKLLLVCIISRSIFIVVTIWRSDDRIHPLMNVCVNVLIWYYLVIGASNDDIMNSFDSDTDTDCHSDFDHCRWTSIHINHCINVPFVCDTASTGKTVWTSTRSIWSGRRNLINADSNSSMVMDAASLKNMSMTHEGLLASLPSWCLFQGMVWYDISLPFCKYGAYTSWSFLLY